MTGERESILRERARKLARPPGAERGPGFEAVVFRLGGERYALPLDGRARVVLPLEELAPLPGAAGPLAGVAPWRGGLLPVADLRLLGGGGAAGIRDLTRIVVLEDEDGSAGLLAESVEELVALDPATLKPLGDEGGGGDGGGARHLRGIMPDATLVLDPAGLLDLLRGG